MIRVVPAPPTALTARARDTRAHAHVRTHTHTHARCGLSQACREHALVEVTFLTRDLKSAWVCNRGHRGSDNPSACPRRRRDRRTELETEPDPLVSVPSLSHTKQQDQGASEKQRSLDLPSGGQAHLPSDIFCFKTEFQHCVQRPPNTSSNVQFLHVSSYFIFLLFFGGAVPAAYGGSQARG